MAVDTYKQIYQGLLQTAVTTLFTVGASESFIIKHMTVVNNDVAARTFALYKNGTAISNIITPPAVSVPAGGMAEWDGTMALGNNDTFRASGSVSGELTLTISGDD